MLGTDGFGRSDSRAKLRHFFEVNRYFVAIAALKALADQGEGKAKTVADAIKKYGIDPEKAGPDDRMKAKSSSPTSATSRKSKSSKSW